MYFELFCAPVWDGNIKNRNTGKNGQKQKHNIKKKI